MNSIEYFSKVIIVIIFLSAIIFVSYGWKGVSQDNYLVPTDLIPTQVPIFSGFSIPIPTGMVPIDPDTYVFFPEVPTYSGCWMGVQVLPGELEACDWINSNTNESAKFVDDIPGAELVMGMTCRVSTVGGDWANAPHAVPDMYNNSEIYSTTDPQRAHYLAVSMNASYLVAPKRTVWAGSYTGPGDNSVFTNTTYFDPVYWNDDVTIYKVV